MTTTHYAASFSGAPACYSDGGDVSPYAVDVTCSACLAKLAADEQASAFAELDHEALAVELTKIYNEIESRWDDDTADRQTTLEQAQGRIGLLIQRLGGALPPCRPSLVEGEF